MLNEKKKKLFPCWGKWAITSEQESFIIAWNLEKPDHSAVFHLSLPLAKLAM